MHFWINHVFIYVEKIKKRRWREVTPLTMFTGTSEPERDLLTWRVAQMWNLSKAAFSSPTPDVEQRADFTLKTFHVSLWRKMCLSSLNWTSSEPTVPRCVQCLVAWSVSSLGWISFWKRGRGCILSAEKMKESHHRLSSVITKFKAFPCLNNQRVTLKWNQMKSYFPTGERAALMSRPVLWLSLSKEYNSSHTSIRMSVTKTPVSTTQLLVSDVLCPLTCLLTWVMLYI